MGIGSTDQENTKKSNADKLTGSLEGSIKLSAKASAGSSFAGVGAKVSAEAKSETNFGAKDVTDVRAREEVASVAVNNHTLEFTTTCSIEVSDEEIAEDKSKGGVGLWQYVISLEDYSASAFTPHTICRRGKLAMTPPKCPYYACLDD